LCSVEIHEFGLSLLMKMLRVESVTLLFSILMGVDGDLTKLLKDLSQILTANDRPYMVVKRDHYKSPFT
jgi:hypothetical protein